MLGKDLEQRSKDLGFEIPVSTLSKIERGEKAFLSVAELFALAAALDCPVTLLLAPVRRGTDVEYLPGQSEPADEALRRLTAPVLPVDERVLGLLSRHVDLVQGIARREAHARELLVDGGMRAVEGLGTMLTSSLTDLLAVRRDLAQLGACLPSLPEVIRDHVRPGRHGDEINPSRPWGTRVVRGPARDRSRHSGF